MPIPRPPDFERYEYDNLLPTWQPPEPLNRPEGHVPQGPIPPPDTPSVLGAKRNIRGELQEPDGGKARRKEGQANAPYLQIRHDKARKDDVQVKIRRNREEEDAAYGSDDSSESEPHKEGSPAAEEPPESSSDTETTQNTHFGGEGGGGEASASDPATVVFQNAGGSGAEEQTPNSDPPASDFPVHYQQPLDSSQTTTGASDGLNPDGDVNGHPDEAQEDVDRDMEDGTQTPYDEDEDMYERSHTPTQNSMVPSGSQGDQHGHHHQTGASHLGHTGAPPHVPQAHTQLQAPHVPMQQGSQQGPWAQGGQQGPWVQGGQQGPWVQGGQQGSWVQGGQQGPWLQGGQHAPWQQGGQQALTQYNTQQQTYTHPQSPYPYPYTPQPSQYGQPQGPYSLPQPPQLMGYNMGPQQTPSALPPPGWSPDQGPNPNQFLPHSAPTRAPTVPEATLPRTDPASQPADPSRPSKPKPGRRTGRNTGSSTSSKKQKVANSNYRPAPSLSRQLSQTSEDLEGPQAGPSGSQFEGAPQPPPVPSHYSAPNGNTPTTRPPFQPTLTRTPTLPVATSSYTPDGNTLPPHAPQTNRPYQPQSDPSTSAETAGSTGSATQPPNIPSSHGSADAAFQARLLNMLQEVKNNNDQLARDMKARINAEEALVSNAVQKAVESIHTGLAAFTAGEAVAESMRRKRAAERTRRGAIKAALASASSSASSAKGKGRALPGDLVEEGEDEGENEDEGADTTSNAMRVQALADEEGMHKNSIQSAVRSHVKSMIAVKDYSKLALACPPLTDEEIEAFACDAPDAPVINPKKLRIDFEHPWVHFPWNVEVRGVIVEDFIEAAKKGEIPKLCVPHHHLTPHSIGTVLDSHMKSLRGKYRDSLKSNTDRLELQKKKKNAIQGRKRTLYDSRAMTLSIRPSLQHILALLDLIKPYHLGEDEIIGPVHPPVYQSRRPLWMSLELDECFVRVDELHREDWAGGRRAGNPPRTIVPHPKGERVRTQAPAGLPINCYDQKYVAKLKQHQKAALDIQYHTVDLSIPADIDAQVQESAASGDSDEEL